MESAWERELREQPRPVLQNPPKPDDAAKALTFEEWARKYCPYPVNSTGYVVTKACWHAATEAERADGGGR